MSVHSAGIIVESIGVNQLLNRQWKREKEKGEEERGDKEI